MKKPLFSIMQGSLSLVLCFVLSTAIAHSAHAAPVATTPPPSSTYNSALAELEKTVFAKAYTKESDETRLSRLEYFVYGQKRSGQITPRLQALQKLLPPIPVAAVATPEPVAPPAQAAQTPPQQIIIQPNDPMSSPGEPEEAYSPEAPLQPAYFSPDMIQGISLVEQKVFRQVFNDPPEVRMNRLETRLFNETAPEMPPEDRLYRVASIVKAQESSQEEKAMSNSLFPPNMASMSLLPQTGRVQRNGFYLNGMPMGQSGFRIGGMSGRGGRSSSGSIMPSLLMILLQSLL